MPKPARNITDHEWLRFEGDPNTTTVKELLEWIEDNKVEGCICSCGKRSKVYKRKFNHGMAKCLIGFYRAHQDQVSKIGAASWLSREALRDHGVTGDGEYNKLRHWDLIEPHPSKRGWWRMTNRPGVRFVLGKDTIQKYALVDDNVCTGFEGDPIKILGAIGDAFDYDELMGL